MAHKPTPDLTVSPSPTPDPTVVLDLLEAFRRSKTMFAAVSLGVFDALALGSKSLDELATTLATNADALQRLLDALAASKKEGRGRASLETVRCTAIAELKPRTNCRSRSS